MPGICRARRSMLAASLFLLASASTALAAHAGRPAPADRIFVGGTVVTVNDAQPRAEAVAVREGRIVAVGTRREVERFRGARTTVRDLGGATLVPGFIDAHSHLAAVGVTTAGANLLPPPDGTVSSIPALQQALRDWAKSVPGGTRYGVIFGSGYDDSQLQEKRHPTREDLDAVSTDVPIVVSHQSGHLAAANSKALLLLGLDAATPDPAGGHIRRRPDSREPNGVLEESAAFAAMGRLVYSKIGTDEMQRLLPLGIETYVRHGFTTAQEGAASPSSVQAYVAAAEAGRLGIDVVAYPEYTGMDRAIMSTAWAGREYRGHFRIGGVKVVLDGSPQGRTAWLTKPYFQVPEGRKADYAGYPAMLGERVQKIVDDSMQNRWQLIAHVNGDAAIDQLLNAVEQGERQFGAADHRFVAIHGQTTRLDQVKRMKALGVVPSFFTMHTFYWGDWHRDVTLGPERAENISPTGWALREGLRFTTHHDAPVVLPNAIRMLSATVNRTTRTGRLLGADQRLEPLDALKSITLWAAWQYFEEDRKGSIEVGKLADFAILSADPLAIPRDGIDTLQVLETVKEGRTVYRRDAATATRAAR